MITVSVRFEASGPQYTYMAEPEDGIEEMDFVVVKVANQYKVVRVVEVHDEPQLTGNYDYKWIVQRIDPTEYDKRTADPTAQGPIVGSRL